VLRFKERMRESRHGRGTAILIVADRDLKESESEKVLELGAQGFLRRPFKTETLVEELGRILGRIL